MLEEGETFHRMKALFGVAAGHSVLFFLLACIDRVCELVNLPPPPLEAGENPSSNHPGDSHSRVVRETPLNPDVWPDAPQTSQ